MKSKVFTKIEANDFIKKVETQLTYLHRGRISQEEKGDRDLAKQIEIRQARILNMLEDFGLKFCFDFEKECPTLDPVVCYHFVEYKGVQKDEN